MAVTSQSARPDSPKPQLHKTKFVDHAGVEATRIRYCSPNEFASQDSDKDPPFAVQVYGIVDIDLEDPDPPPAGTTHNSLGSKVERFLSYIDVQPDNDERPPPLYEVYARQNDVFACVEHQRREIAHRKAHRQDPATILIPKWEMSADDDGRTGALIVLTSSSFQLRGSCDGSNDPGGPLWVQFDRRAPSSYSMISQAERSSGGATDSSELHEDVDPEKMEITVTKIQAPSGWRREVAYLWYTSYSPEEVPMMDFGLAEEEGPLATSDEGEAMANLAQAVQQLKLDDFSSDHPADDRVLVSNHRGAGQPDLQYVVYATFLQQSGPAAILLGHAAQVFAFEIATRLPSGTSVSFDVRKPPQPTISSALEHYRASRESSSEQSVGALAADGQERIHPQSYVYEHPRSTSWFEPYKTFIILLDKPDFVHECGVVFVMTDGGQSKQLESDPTGFRSGPSIDYVQTRVLRAPDMKEVATRLSMVWPFEELNL